MDLRLTAKEKRFREEVRDFIATNLPEDIRSHLRAGHPPTKDHIVRWHRILNTRGWATAHWPKEWGGAGLSPVERMILTEEIFLAPAPTPLVFNSSMIGPVIIQFGSEEQKRQFLPKIANLDIWFCQGFSEPDAGSDLASLRTLARRDGDHYVVTGQKIWTTMAHHADWMFCLVRTDPAAKKQVGISMLLIDMKTPGVTVRPIMSIDGHHHLNEVFLDEVRVPVENRVGEENKGWDYAKFLLGHERTGIAGVGRSKERLSYARELATQVKAGKRPLAEDPCFREQLALIEADLKALEITQLRVVAGHAGHHADKPDPLTSVLKVRGTELYQAVCELACRSAGPAAIAIQPAGGAADELDAAPRWGAALAPSYFYSRAASIYGGSNEIQKNILAKTVLGL
ncbi:acyl-CoA dehydrogenase family protein [Azoarcus sp. DN11]|uniref:acyl-CoA dehydrogenase family protein n=1 Tax=Azoarcus sp. DN11 TaxID=356837 RepID=UPI000EB3F7BE|nr:acyl-CoA dehydrogenase family protein [Azoarcus sp. DN11]AYH43562.1 pimeloyl-CoA dehydrogenase large subunit [Azoarcus sp. DN11]